MFSFKNFINNKYNTIERASAEHEKLQATYKVIADIDRERSLSDSSINKLICLCRLLCFHEFRKMKKIRQRIKKWKKTES